MRKGQKHTQEAKNKIGLVSKGRKVSLESREKMSISKKGKNSYQWKGGVSRAYKTGYYSIEYKKWRMKIFERDLFTCQFCGIRGNQTGGYLTAHHIKSFSKYPELRFNLNNGVCLCNECHKLTDNYKGKANK